MVWVEYALVFLPLGPLLAVAEWANPECDFVPGGHVPLWRRHTDWAFVALQLALVPALALLVTWWAPALIAHGPLHTLTGSLPMVATSAFAFLVADLVAYWTHRAEHRWRYTWRFHAVHHSPPQLDWLAGRRFHPLDVVVEQLLPVGAVAALGVPLADLGPYLFAAGVVTVLAHSNVAVPGRWLARVVVTPGYHRSHHERGRDGSNFALVLPVLDVLFGTASFQAGARSFGTNAGVPESGFVALLRWGFGLRGGSPGPAQRVSTTSPAQNDRALAT